MHVYTYLFQAGANNVPNKGQKTNLFSVLGQNENKTTNSSAHCRKSPNDTENTKCAAICVDDGVDSDVIPDTPKGDKHISSRNGPPTHMVLKPINFSVENQINHEGVKTCLGSSVTPGKSPPAPDDLIPDTPKSGEGGKDKTKSYKRSRAFLHSATEYVPKAFLAKKEKKEGPVSKMGSIRTNNAVHISDKKVRELSILPTEPLPEEDSHSGAKSLSLVMTDMGLFEDAQRALGVHRNQIFDKARVETKAAIEGEGSMDITEFPTQEVVSRGVKRSPSRGNSPNPKKFFEQLTHQKILDRPKMKLNFEPPKKPEIKPVDKYAMLEQEKKRLAERAKGKSGMSCTKRWGLTKHSLKSPLVSKEVEESEDDQLNDILNSLKVDNQTYKNNPKYSKQKALPIVDEAPELVNTSLCVEEIQMDSDIPEDDGLDDIMAELRSQYSTKKSELAKSLSKVSHSAHHKLANKKVKKHCISKLSRPPTSSAVTPTRAKHRHALISSPDGSVTTNGQIDKSISRNVEEVTGAVSDMALGFGTDDMDVLLSEFDTTTEDIGRFVSTLSL